MTSEVLFQPLSNYVLIEMLPVPEGDTSPGGIYLPTESTQTYRAKVVAVGPGIPQATGQVIPVSVQVGDIVHMGRNNSTPVVVGDKEYFILRDSELMGIFLTKE